ncbi:protein kinase domain-containing protein [Cellulosimicrobium funkei]|uniref:serine/threonine-protein kinase n=1 Tax=Cellulosimicrobium funkei TaxID=264251 RepID=UPI0037DCD05A
MKPVRGLTLGNRYRLVRRIAVGGMGEVWVAADDALGREVAVKVLRSEYAGNEDFLNRLRTEARNSAALSHPNIAQMYDYGETNGSGYLVMELVVGEPMADLLEREPVLPPARLLPILAQTARALHAAHLSGVVHRDVKPGNILIDRSGTVKITDFGVSLAANQVPMTATGMVMGTAQYLSPEQAVGQAATGASDIYALGIVAYESIAGNRPFTGSTPVDIAVAHVNEPVPPLPTSVDPELGELVMVMLAKDPLARPHPADALARVFEGIGARLASDPWSARTGAPAPTRRARRARSTADDVPAPEPDPAPVITPLVIPAAVRDPHAPDPTSPWVAPEPRRAAHAASAGETADVPPPSAGTPPGPPDDDATHVRPLGRHGGTVPATAEPVPPAPPAPDDAAPGPALPWERPVPAAPADDPGAPRSYPPRREMHGPTRSSRRPQPTRAGTRPAGAPGRPASPTRVEPVAPATRAEARRQSQSAPVPSRSAGRRTSTTTGRRLGGLPNGLTWPLVALLGLLLVLVIATIATLGDRDGDGGDAAPVRGAETSVEVAVPDAETLPGRVTS